MYLGFEVHFKQSFSFLTSSTLILSLNFSIVLPYTALFVSVCNAFPSLSPFFSTSILFSVLNSTYGFSHCDWLNSYTRCIFLVLILASDKVASFNNKAHTFLYRKKVGSSFLTLAIGILQKPKIINWYLGNISFLIFILSGA